jgi:hypothetical protein
MSLEQLQACVTCISQMSVMAPAEANWKPIRCSYTVLPIRKLRVPTETGCSKNTHNKGQVPGYDDNIFFSPLRKDLTASFFLYFSRFLFAFICPSFIYYLPLFISIFPHLSSFLIFLPHFPYPPFNPPPQMT